MALENNISQVTNITIEVAREKFTRSRIVWNSRKSCQLSFDEIIERIKRGVSHTSIARDAGISKQGFERLFRVRFRPLLLENEGNILDRRQYRAFQLQETIRMLRGKGFRIAAGLRKSEISVNGALCGFRCVTNLYNLPHCKRPYSHTDASPLELTRYQFLIVLSRVKGYAPADYNIPVKKLLEANKSVKRIPIVIPLEDFFIGQKPHRFPIENYKDAWYLFP